MWYLRWVPHALAHGDNPLISHHLNFPDGVNLMWNTSMPLAGFLLAPITLTLGPIVAFNVLTTMGVALSGFCAYVMLRRYVDAPIAAGVGAALYGFSPYIVNHAAAHPNLPTAFIPPLLFLVIDEILVRQRRRPIPVGVALGGLAFAQLMLSSELLATEFVMATVALIVLVFAYASEVAARARHAVIALSVAVGSALALGAPPLAVMLFGDPHVRTGALWGPDIFVSDLVGFVIPRSNLLVEPAWTREVTSKFTDSCCPAEAGTYIGFPLLILLVIVVIRWWSRPMIRITGTVAAVAAILSMGPHLHVAGVVSGQTLPFKVFEDVPIINNMLAGRFMLYVYLLAGVIVAILVDHVWRAQRYVTVGVLAAIALLPLAPKPNVVSTRASTPAFFTAGARQIPRGSVALVAPFSRDTSTAEPMLWQAVAHMRFRMPSGYTIGPDRSGHMAFMPIPTTLSRTMEEIQRGKPLPVLDATLRAELARDMKRMRVRSVVVGPMDHRDAMVSFFTALLEREPRRVRGVELWLGVRPGG